MLDMEKNYKLAGYIWSFVKVDKNHAVIQSHGVTAGPWPGFKMLKFGGKVDDFYATDLDGEDISAYDDKMLALYDALKDVEDKSASYGKGLYLVSREKSGFTELCKPGSGNYWQALKRAAENASLFGAADYHAYVLPAVVHTRGMCTGTATSTATATRTATTMWLPPLSISTYPRWRLLKMKLSSKRKVQDSWRINQIQPHTVPFGNMAWILQKMAKHFILIRRW